VPTGRRLVPRNRIDVEGEPPIAVRLNVRTPDTIATTPLGMQPAVSWNSTVKVMVVVGVPARGVASGAVRLTVCEAPLQLAARAVGGRPGTR
jgi:hypothetical protein